MTALATRAVLRPADGMGSVPGSCQGCGEDNWRQGTTKFGHGAKVVIANVYKGKRWARRELWHPQCYIEAGEPCGTAS